MRILVALVVAVAVGGCGTSSDAPAVVTDPAEAGQLAQIAIPPSATGLECRTESGIDRLTYGRFDIPAAELPTVLAGATAEPYSEHSVVTDHVLSDPWWRPETLRNPRVAEWSVPGFSVNLMFGESDRPGVLTVYFFNFTL